MSYNDIKVRLHSPSLMSHQKQDVLDAQLYKVSIFTQMQAVFLAEVTIPGCEHYSYT